MSMSKHKNINTTEPNISIGQKSKLRHRRFRLYLKSQDLKRVFERELFSIQSSKCDLVL